MVAYNFQERFVGPIANGTKRQTIRRIGRRRHARPGDKLQLYTGMRTKKCRRIIGDVICLSVQPVTIRVSEAGIAVVVDAAGESQLERFARSDGFASADDFHRFWLEFHGCGEVEHLLIRWGDLVGKTRG